MNILLNMIVATVVLYDSGYYHFVNTAAIRDYLEAFLITKGLG